MKFEHVVQAAMPTLLGWLSPAAALPNSGHKYLPRNASAISWGKCEESGQTAVPDNVDCGILMVPLDHFDSKCDSKIKIGMTRLKANDTSKRQGTLFYNLGGPGQSSSPWLIAQAQMEAQGVEPLHFGKAIRDNFDIVGVDMRGEGRSEPLSCNVTLLNAVEGPVITDEEVFNRSLAQSKALGESCAEMSGPLFYHMGTNQAVRDLDLVREAVGSEKLNFIGWSYGTQLGAEYAETFPERVGRMTLDGVYNRGMDDETTLLTGAVGYESTLNRFFAWCNETTACALHGKDLPTMYDEILASAPIAVPECENKGCKTSLTQEDFVYAILAGTVSLHDGDPKPPQPQTGGWFKLAEGLAAAHAGNATAFSQAYETSNTTSTETLAISFINIFCADRPKKALTAADYKSTNIIAKVLAPRTLGMSVPQKGRAYCLGWPAEPEDPPHTLDLEATKKLPPIMLVSNFYDEATVAQWVLGLRAQMPTAINIFRNGGGHTSYLHYGETADAMISFIVNGTLPEDGTVFEN